MISTVEAPPGQSVQLALTHRYLGKPTLAQCVVCGQYSWLELVVAVNGEDQAVCFSCFEAVEHLSRFAAKRALLLEQD